MKHWSLLSGLRVAIALIIVAWVPSTAFSQTRWTKHQNNPIFMVGNTNTWDNFAVSGPVVLFDSSWSDSTRYRMWYTGNDGFVSRMGYATSPDGLLWSKFVGNPILDAGPPGSWDVGYCDVQSVLFDSTRNDSVKYQLWYTGWEGDIWRVGHAISPDGITWTKDSANPVLNAGPTGSWDDRGVADPAVQRNGATYQMWYWGFDGAVGRIGYASSPNGIVWTKYQGNPVIDVEALGSWDSQLWGYTRVLFDSSWSDSTRYRMWYTGYDGVLSRIGYATSPDGISWTKDPANPVLNVGLPGTWEDNLVFDASLLHDTQGFRMWYSGSRADNRSRIGYATSLITGTPHELGNLPENYALRQNYPNPFNPSTVISFQLPVSSSVILKVYNVLGQEVATLVNEEMKLGSYEVTWDATGLASGVYFYRLIAADISSSRHKQFVETRKLLLLK